MNTQELIRSLPRVEPPQVGQQQGRYWVRATAHNPDDTAVAMDAVVNILQGSTVNLTIAELARIIIDRFTLRPDLVEVLDHAEEKVKLDSLLSELRRLDANGWCTVTDGTIDDLPIAEKIEIVENALKTIKQNG